MKNKKNLEPYGPAALDEEQLQTQLDSTGLSGLC